MEVRPGAVTVRAAAPSDPWVRGSLSRVWGTTFAARKGELIDLSTLPALIAVQAGRPIGVATYLLAAGDCEVVSIHAEVPRAGAGGSLLRAVEARAREAAARRVWLITTNDNTGALRFYQRAGYDLVALYRDAVTRARATLKPEIPLEIDGIAVRHELELERALD